jgi:hypothetical protein
MELIIALLGGWIAGIIIIMYYGNLERESWYLFWGWSIVIIIIIFLICLVSQK